MIDPERVTDADLAKALLHDLGAMAPDADDPPALIRFSARAWIARQITEAPRHYGADKAWRGIESRTDGIVAAVLQIVGARGMQSDLGSRGRGLPPEQDQDWDDIGMDRVGGVALHEIAQMSNAEYAEFRRRIGLNGQGRGIFSQEEKWA